MGSESSRWDQELKGWDQGSRWPDQDSKGWFFWIQAIQKCHQRFVDECLVIICEVFLGDFFELKII